MQTLSGWPQKSSIGVKFAHPYAYELPLCRWCVGPSGRQDPSSPAHLELLYNIDTQHYPLSTVLASVVNVRILGLKHKTNWDEYHRNLVS